MSMFPGPGARIYYNEAGEPLGWDYPPDPEEYDPDDYDLHNYDPDEDEDEDACDHFWSTGGTEGRICNICGKVEKREDQAR